MSDLKALKDLTSRQFAELCHVLPDLKKRGLTLFLGSEYAACDCRILMLGINPGSSDDLPEDYGLRSSNCLIGDPGDPDARKFVYWRNARRCFGATAELKHKMARATYTFCIPFRTPNWSGLRKLERLELKKAARPILQQILADCRPEFILCAGATARTILMDLSDLSSVDHETLEGRQGRNTWTADAVAVPWGSSEVLKVPHFSRFHSKEGLRACGVWLTAKLAT